MKTKKVKTTEIVESSDDVRQVLIKKALGYEAKEIVEEYSLVDNDLKLVKKKVNTKVYPPDLDAIEMALNSQPSDEVYDKYTDEELLAERDKLVQAYMRMNKGDK